MVRYASILLLSVLVAAAQPDPPPLVEATVNRVISGDTLDAQINGVRPPVGLLGVEAPALNQPCGPESLARTAELAGTTVQLQADPLHAGLDPRRRVLYAAFTADGTSIAETLIAEGLAHAAQDADVLLAVEQEAQANHVGCLWDT